MKNPIMMRVLVPQTILQDFDKVVENYGSDRSEYIRNLMRAEILAFNKNKK